MKNTNDTKTRQSKSAAALEGFGQLAAMFLLGAILWTSRQYIDPYHLIRLAAVLHLIGAVVKSPKIVRICFLIPAFSLYTVFLTDQMEQYPLLAVLVMGGVFDVARKHLESRSRWKKLVSPACAGLVLLGSYAVTMVPNVLLQDKLSASIASEYSYFFFRPADPQDGVRYDGVVVWQDPAPVGFPLSIRPCFADSHSVFSFLPFPVWPTLKYKLGERPSIKITHLRPGHGTGREPLVSVACGKDNGVTQFHRIFGTFRSLDRGNDQLYLRVLVMPITSVSRLHDKTRRYWVQPHDATGKDGAELKLTYRDACSGNWHCDAFFGGPQHVGTRFEIRAVITSRNFRRGQRIRVDEIENMVQACDRVTVVRER